MRKHKGFTLIELVVVVMILGILAAVAAPKLLNTSGTATDNGIKESLGVVRDAIERFAAEHGGTLPGANGNEATFTSDLGTYLRGNFPKSPIGVGGNGINVVGTGGPLSADATPAKAWKYSSLDGSFICNSGANTKVDQSTRYDQL